MCTTLDEVYSGLNNAADRLVVIEFYANWCDRCKLMFSQVEQIANNSPNVNFLKVDVDQNREAVEEFDVHPEFQNPQLPTFILMKNNQRVGEMFGETNAAKLKDLVEKHGKQILNLHWYIITYEPFILPLSGPSQTSLTRRKNQKFIIKVNFLYRK